MDSGTIEAIQRAIVSPEAPMVNGRERLLLPDGWKDATPSIPTPQPIKVATLTAVADYLEHGVDTLPESMLHVVGPERVELVAKVEDEENQFRRKTWLVATSFTYDASFFGQYHECERFMIALQSQFLDTDQRNSLIELLASIRDSEVTETVDSGYAQEVKTARGVALLDRTKVPNPVVLAPYRTFREVGQPSSAFVFRLKRGAGDKPGCALFEADGGLWRLKAIEAIGVWLRQQIPGVPVVA